MTRINTTDIGLNTNMDPPSTGSAANKVDPFVETQIKVLEILLGEDEAGDTETDQLLDWFDRLCGSQPKNTELRFVNRNGCRLVLPQLFAALRECLLNHRWAEACELLIRISAEPKGASTVLQHVGLELMRQMKFHEAEQLCNKFQQHIKLLSQQEIHIKSTLLDHFFYLMELGKVQEAKDALVDNPAKQGPRPTITTPRASQVNKYLHKAYEGLAYYALWLQLVKKSDEQPKGDGWCGVGSLAAGENVEAKLIAERAAACFECLQNEEGVFDTFISHHVEILEYLQKIEEAKYLLKDYVKKNQSNPNACRLFVAFCKRHDLGKRHVVKTLSALCSAVPSDALSVIELHELLPEDSVNERLNAVISCLDYDVNRKNEQLWYKLVLDIVSSGNLCREAFGELWIKRQTWWLEYHFNQEELDLDIAELPSLNLSENAPLNLLICKASFSCVVFGAENVYSRSVMNLCSEDKAICKTDVFQLYEQACKMSPFLNVVVSLPC